MFNELITNQQQSDFLLVRGLDFETFTLRLLDEVALAAQTLRKERLLDDPNVQEILALAQPLSDDAKATLIQQLKTNVEAAVTAVPTAGV